MVAAGVVVLLSVVRRRVAVGAAAAVGAAVVGTWLTAVVVGDTAGVPLHAIRSTDMRMASTMRSTIRVTASLTH